MEDCIQLIADELSLHISQAWFDTPLITMTDPLHSNLSVLDRILARLSEAELARLNGDENMKFILSTNMYGLWDCS